MTLLQLAERYFLFQVLKQESQNCYLATVKTLEKQLPAEALSDIRNITTEMLLQFRAILLKKGSPVSFNTHRNRLRTLCRFAVQDGALSANPVERVGLAPVPEKRQKTISTEVARLAISHLEASSKDPVLAKFWIAVTKMLYYTGIRRRQLVGLRWGDIDFARELLTLRSDSSKTRREWLIPLPTDTVSELKWLREKRLESRKMIDPDDPVFDITLLRANAPVLSGPAVTTYYWNLGQKLSLKISPHRFRHSVATEIVNSTGNLRVAQEILGHADVKTTCGYVQPSTSAMRSAMQHIASLG